MIEIRSYEKSDWSAIQRIHDAARRDELRLAGLEDAFLPLSEAAEREGLFGYHVDVAAADGRVRGFSAYSEEELAWLYVDPEAYRSGIGKALLVHALRKCPGISAIEVLEGNAPARALYESCGFGVGETVCGVMPGNESFSVRAWLMRPVRAE